MAALGTYFIDADDLADATAVFDDIDMTTEAADGWYSNGTIVREQSSGLLLPAEDCDCP